MRTIFMALALTACVDERTVELGVESVSLPQGADVNVAIFADGYEIPNLESFELSVDPPEIATAALTPDGTHVRVTGTHPGDAVVRIRHRFAELLLPTHVDPPAIVILWIEPSDVTTPVGSLVPIRATGVDTMGVYGDVSARTSWAVIDPTIARLDSEGLRGMSTGETTLHASIDGVATSVGVSIDP